MFYCTVLYTMAHIWGNWKISNREVGTGWDFITSYNIYRHVIMCIYMCVCMCFNPMTTSLNQICILYSIKD